MRLAGGGLCRKGEIVVVGRCQWRLRPDWKLGKCTDATGETRHAGEDAATTFHVQSRLTVV